MKKRIIGTFLAMFLAVVGFALAYDQSSAKVKTVKKSVVMTKKETKTLKASGAKKWTTSKKAVATVTKKGKVTAKKAGTAKITAKAKGKNYVFTVKVEDPKISAGTAALKVGGTTALKVNGTSRKVTWSSSNATVASVDASGKVTAKAAGSAVISGKVGTKNYSCTVTVTAADDKKDDPKDQYVEDKLFIVKMIKDGNLYISDGPSEELMYIIKISDSIVVKENGAAASIDTIAVGDYITPKFLATQPAYPGIVTVCVSIDITEKGEGVSSLPLTILTIENDIMTLQHATTKKKYTVRLLDTLYIEKDGAQIAKTALAVGDKVTVDYFTAISIVKEPYPITGCSKVTVVVPT